MSIALEVSLGSHLSVWQVTSQPSYPKANHHCSSELLAGSMVWSKLGKPRSAPPSTCRTRCILSESLPYSALPAQPEKPEWEILPAESSAHQSRVVWSACRTHCPAQSSLRIIKSYMLQKYLPSHHKLLHYLWIMKGFRCMWAMGKSLFAYGSTWAFVISLVT